MTDRQHFYRPLVDETGELLRYASIRVLTDDGVTVYPGTLWRDDTSDETWVQPFIASPALVEFWIEGGARLRLGITTDDASPEQVSEVIDVFVDAEEIVHSTVPVFVSGPMPKRAVLGRDASNAPSWQVLRIDHEHAGRAPDTEFVGPIDSRYQQVHGFTRSTVYGAQTGGWGAYSGLLDTSMLGHAAIAYGEQTTALGHNSYAAEATTRPYLGGAVAIGEHASAQNDAVAIGTNAEAWSHDGPTVGVGREALASGAWGTALGVFAHADTDDVAIGWNTGSSSWGATGSIGLGADAQYGLPSAITDSMWAVMLGAHDPKADRKFPWANPKGSQSESWMNEYLPTMQFADKTVQLQRHLSTVLAGLVEVDGDVTLGREDSLLGFYGATPVVQTEVGDDEPASGMHALDSLIYALRDLGLLKYRHEALANYQAADLEPLYRDGDLIESWREHHHRDTLRVPTGMARPSFYAEDYNDHPSVWLRNSTQYDRQIKPRQAFLSDNLIPQAKHFLTIASHNRDGRFGHWEALLNLYQNPRPNDVDDVVFVSQAHTAYWSTVQSQFQYAGSVYAEDNCTQTGNLRATLDGWFHAWRATNPLVWPYARLTVGGGHDLQLDHDNWQGCYEEVVAMDKTWSERAVRSMTSGLMFRYRINQNDDQLIRPAEQFLEAQHEPVSGVRIKWDESYPDDYTGWVHGHVWNLHKPLKYSPYVDIFDWFDCYDYYGPEAGYWANLPDTAGPNLFGIIGVPIHYQVLVTSTRCDQTRGIFTEDLLGFYFLGNVGIWTTGMCWISRGYKKAYLMDRRTNKVLARSDQCQRTYYDDVEVRIYTRDKSGVLTQRATETLWGDGRFSSEFYYPGVKVARVYEISTGKMLTSTEWAERALPRWTVIDNSDADYSDTAVDVSKTYDTALAVMAFCESGRPDYYRRARNILATLSSITNDDGSLNDQYSSSDPEKSAGRKSVRAVIWVGLAALHYQQITGDTRFQGFIDRLALWLFGQQSDGSFRRTPDDMTRSTETSAAGYFFFRSYAATV